jgi:hypothetical protein
MKQGVEKIRNALRGLRISSPNAQEFSSKQVIAAIRF